MDLNKIKKYFGKYFDKKKRKKIKQENQETGFKLYQVIIIMIIAVSIGIISGTVIAYPYMTYVRNTDDKGRVNRDLEQVSNVYESILNNYFETVEKEELIEAAINGMLKHLGDPYTHYFDLGERKDFNERMKGEYYGIGVELITDNDGNIIIINVFDSSPAKLAGVLSGDIIKALDDNETEDMTSADVAKYIKEGQSEQVDVTLDRAGKLLTVTINKQRIILESVSSEVFEKNNKKIGYVNISLFADNTYNQFQNAITELESKEIDSLIIDVRNNSGGYLNAVVNITSMFLPKDSIIYQMQTNKETIKYYDTTVESKSYPVIVLINEYSASASEILAAAFKEVYAGEVIGVTSFGKGTVQETQNLKNGGMIKITTQKWLTPDGNSIEGVGIDPTIEVIQDKKYYNNPSHKLDTQLQKALELLSK